jgi:hypothetical protein
MTEQEIIDTTRSQSRPRFNPNRIPRYRWVPPNSPYFRGRRVPQRFNRRRGFRPRRRALPRPRLRIVYGQQQDLAFKSRPRRKGVGNVMTAPLKESQTISSYFKFVNDVITFCQPIPTQFYTAPFATIPLHPMLYYGRTANIALNFANYQLNKVVVHYVPLIGTSGLGMVAIGSTRNCTPITGIGVNQFTDLTQINAQINPVWMCNRYAVPDLDTELKMMAPVTRHDIPNVVYVATTGIIGTLIATGTLFIEMSVRLSRPVPSASLYPNPGTLVLLSTPVGYSINIANNGVSHGIVLSSTATNIDIGEYVKIPCMPSAGTFYINVTLFHNDAPMNYLNATDNGTILVAYFTEY